jgi:hypothetical protein
MVFDANKLVKNWEKIFSENLDGRDCQNHSTEDAEASIGGSKK